MEQLFGMRLCSYFTSPRPALVGGVTQWLGRRALAGGLSLTYMPHLLLTGDNFVGKVSAMGQPTSRTQPATPPGSVNVITWITRVENRKPSNGTPTLPMVVWSQIKVRGRKLGPRPIGWTLAPSVTQKRRRSCSMRQYGSHCSVCVCVCVCVCMCVYVCVCSCRCAE